VKKEGAERSRRNKETEMTGSGRRRCGRTVMNDSPHYFDIRIHFIRERY
jgi:hypothetical protein